MPPEARSIFDLFTYHEPVQDKWRGIFSKNFNISFPKYGNGSLTIKINYPGKSYNYQATNTATTNGLTPLVKAVVDLLEHIGEYDKYFGTLRSHTRAIHSGEPTEYVWDFNRRGRELRILLRQDPNLDYELDRFYNNYTSDELELEHETVTEASIKAPLQLAFKIDVELFVVKLYLACRKLMAGIPATTHQQAYEKQFPVELLSRLEQWLLLETPPFTGLWHYTGTDYSNRVAHIQSPEKFTVSGRRMATNAELQKEGLW